MRKLSIILLLLAIVLVPVLSIAQGGNTISITGSGAPTGTCSFIFRYIDSATGTEYNCKAGAWNSVGGGAAAGTVTVVGAGSLTSTALVTGGGTQTLQTPSATATLNSSGNMSLPGTIAVTGHTTFEGVTTTGATGTGNMVYSISPTFTSVPAAPTAAALTSTTQLATTAFVRANSQSAYLTSLYTNATTTFSNVTGLSFAVAANTNYKVSCDLDYQTSATTADVKIQWTGPASPTFLVYDLVSQVTASTLSNSVNPATATTTGAFSTALSEAGTPTINTNFPLTLTLTLINGANAGTVQLQAAATGTGTVSILPGSCVLNQ